MLTSLPRVPTGRDAVPGSWYAVRIRSFGHRFAAFASLSMDHAAGPVGQLDVDRVSVEVGAVGARDHRLVGCTVTFSTSARIARF